MSGHVFVIGKKSLKFASRNIENRFQTMKKGTLFTISWPGHLQGRSIIIFID